MRRIHSNRFPLAVGDGRVEHFWKSSSCFKESDLYWEWWVREGRNHQREKKPLLGFIFAVTHCTILPWPSLQKLALLKAMLSERKVPTHIITFLKRDKCLPYMKEDLTLYTGIQKERYCMCKGLAGAAFLFRCFIRDINGIQAIGPWAVVFWCCSSLAHFPDFVLQDCSAENLR